MLTHKSNMATIGGIHPVLWSRINRLEDLECVVGNHLLNLKTRLSLER